MQETVQKTAAADISPEVLSALWVLHHCQRFRFCRKFNTPTKSEFDRISKYEKEPHWIVAAVFKVSYFLLINLGSLFSILVQMLLDKMSRLVLMKLCGGGSFLCHII